jgi:hypothetical protein
MAAIEVLDMALCWGCCEASVRTEKGVFKNLGKLGGNGGGMKNI